jgi:DNA-binding IclR family transcriptional regulator
MQTPSEAPDELEPRTGTQSIERAVQVLRELASRGRLGWGLWDLAARCGLSRATTHRILGALVRARLAAQRATDRHYLPGPLVFELSLSMPAYAEFQAACRAPLGRLSKRFGAQAILYLRSGSDWVCAAFSGPSVYVGGGLEVGTRRPLVSTAGGVAILIALPLRERRLIMDQNFRQIERLGDAAVKKLEKLIRRSEGLGYAFNQSETNPGVHSFGVALREHGPGGPVYGSIAVSGHAEDFPVTRATEVIAAMQEEAARIEREATRIFGN